MKYLFLLALILVLFVPLVAQEEDKNEISIFVGATTNDDATAATFGVDYQHRLTRLIGLGALIDHAGGDIKSTLIAPAIFFHVKSFEFVAAPGLEFSGDDTTMTYRLGVSYEIELSRFNSQNENQQAIFNWPENLPVYDHVVIVIEENKDYKRIIGNKHAPYINMLREEGANFTQAYGEEHHSQGNYFWLFSGSNQNVGFMDIVPHDNNNPGYPFTSSNLAQQLIKFGYSFKGYSEDLPYIGFTGNYHGLYFRKHVPWISFSNIPNGNTVETSCNLRFQDFPKDFNDLPTVSFVIPNIMNDMHSGNTNENISAGDTWLKENLDDYYQWAKNNNSLLVMTFDEDNDTWGYEGLTDPAKHESVLKNQIVSIFAGAHIKPGDYPEGKGITHVNILRTLEAMYGLSKSGAQQPHALEFGIKDDFLITDIFETK